MEDEFENIILDEEDNLNGLESLREKTKDKENININKKFSNKNIINNNYNNKKEKESEEKEISEEYNDFNYNIEDNKDEITTNEKNENHINNIREINSDLNNNINNLKEIDIKNKKINLFNKTDNEEKKDNFELNEEQPMKQNEENETNNSLNIIQAIEENFNLAKNELELILTQVEFNEIKELTEQNNQLIMTYISKFDEIMNSIFEVFPKG